MIENTGWAGQFDVFVKTSDGDWEHDRTIKNTITDGGLNLLRDCLYSNTTDAKIRYIAVGTSSATTLTTATKLNNEIFRKTIYSSTTVSTGSVQNVGIFFETEAVAQIEEIGIFAGSTASSTKDTGIMISRILYSRNKTNLESIQITRTDTIGRS